MYLRFLDVLDVTTAYFNADIVTQNKEVIVVKVPAVFRMIGIKEKYWKVRRRYIII